MSGTTVKTASEGTSPGKTKKRGSQKKAAKKTAARKTTTRKKTAAKKAVSKKPAVKKTAARKISIKTAGIQPQKKKPAPEQAGTADGDRSPEDTRSLSWMSAQAASALKAVKASQAEKGQAVLERTRKQAAEKHLDDDSLIRIAAEMPVDNDALEAFSTEQPLQEQSRQPNEASSAVPPVMDASGDMTGPSSQSNATLESTTDLRDDEVDVTTTSTEHVKPTRPAAPKKSAKRPVVFLPALAASLLFAALSLGYYFWPGGDTGSPVMAVQESAEPEPSAVVIDLIEAQEKNTADVATTPLAEPEQESAEVNSLWTPATVPGTWEESDPPQTTAITPAVEPETVPVEPSPIISSDAPRQVQPAQPAQPVQPAQPAQPAQPVQPAQPAQPALPVQPGQRAPAQGYYPQQRRPAYPQYYYR